MAVLGRSRSGPPPPPRSNPGSAPAVYKLEVWGSYPSRRYFLILLNFFCKLPIGNKFQLGKNKIVLVKMLVTYFAITVAHHLFAWSYSPTWP